MSHQWVIRYLWRINRVEADFTWSHRHGNMLPKESQINPNPSCSVFAKARTHRQVDHRSVCRWPHAAKCSVQKQASHPSWYDHYIIIYHYDPIISYQGTMRTRTYLENISDISMISMIYRDLSIPPVPRTCRKPKHKHASRGSAKIVSPASAPKSWKRP